MMKEELIQLQPKLIATGKEVEETLVVVNSQTEAAVAQKAVVQAEEAAASEKAAAAKAIKVLFARPDLPTSVAYLSPTCVHQNCASPRHIWLCDCKAEYLFMPVGLRMNSVP